MEQTATKRCKKCSATKATTEFYPEKRNRDGLGSYCRACCRTNTKASRTPEGQRRAHLAHRYGMTPEQYEEMLEAQRGVCFICHRPNLNGSRLAVDHNHTTGAVRALLCGPCNRALGYMSDCPDRLRAAAAYIEKHESAD